MYPDFQSRVDKEGDMPSKSQKAGKVTAKAQAWGGRLLSGPSGNDETAKEAGEGAGSGRWSWHHAEEDLTHGKCSRSDYEVRGWASQPESHYAP